MNKKILSALLALTMIFNMSLVLAEGTVRLMGLTGPTSMGMAGILKDKNIGENKYEFEAVGTADEIVAKLSAGEVDIAAMPLTLASALYNKTEGKLLKVLDINTLGVLYIVGQTDEIKSFADLKGKEILASGRGTTPEYSLRYLLQKNGIDPDKDININFKSEATEIVSLLKADEKAIAMIPQPFVTIAQSQITGLKPLLSLSDEWQKLNKDYDIITGVCVVRTEFLEKNPKGVENFLKDHENSAKFVNDNNAEAAKIIEENGIFKAAVAEKALPYCNIRFIAGDEMKKLIGDYLKIMFEANPKAVGGAVPDDNFYVSIQK